MSIYEIKSLTHRYEDKPVLDIDRLEIEGSSIVGLAGPNGSGKSTLLRLLGLIERPTSGQIFFNGQGFIHISIEHFSHNSFTVKAACNF